MSVLSYHKIHFLSKLSFKYSCNLFKHIYNLDMLRTALFTLVTGYTIRCLTIAFNIISIVYCLRCEWKFLVLIHSHFFIVQAEVCWNFNIFWTTLYTRQAVQGTAIDFVITSVTFLITSCSFSLRGLNSLI